MTDELLGAAGELGASAGQPTAAGVGVTALEHVLGHQGPRPLWLLGFDRFGDEVPREP